ncbi:MAG: SpoIIE family protein phosphatase, partial [Actinobacteria bacterium]|nr:SpoIIE family protein phosphatase [Actinomycetota bacterium]
YCSAGHPPPLVLDPEGGSRFLEPSGQGPVGTARQRAVIDGDLALGHVLLLYTDGIVERPGTNATAGTVELLQMASEAVADRLMPVFSAASPVDRATTQTLERLTRYTGSSDDITLLALERRPRPEPLHLEVDSRPSPGADGRAAVRNWFRPGQLDATSGEVLDQIVTELCDNAAEHAYLGTAGPIAVDVALSQDGVATITVSDRGRWRPPSEPSTSRGLGLAIVQHLADTTVVDPSKDGTTVTVELRPWKQAQGMEPRPPTQADSLFDVYVEHAPARSILYVRGVVDTSVTGELEAQLELSTTPGAPDLTIDLEDVTMLSSAAIHAIRTSLDSARRTGVEVDIECRPGSLAHQILALAAIPTTWPRSRP